MTSGRRFEEAEAEPNSNLGLPPLPPAAAAGRPTTVIVLDDSSLTRSMLVRLLSREGYRILPAADESEAVNLLAGERPDLILLDINPPWLEGMDLLAKLEADPNWRAIPVLMLGSVGDAEVMRQAGRFGDKGCIVKASFSVAELLRDVHDLTAYRPR